ncbi:MAG: hypothetical protein JJU20_06510 [Opitutales bacterium]|nr:hypothetical protein [Opitutales bacterium]
MDISAIIAPVLSQITQQVFNSKPPQAMEAAQAATFEKLMAEQSIKLAATPVHEWPAVKEAISAAKDHKPYALSIDADGSLSVLGQDGSKHLVNLDESARQILGDRYAGGPHPLEIPLDSLRSTTDSERPLHLVAQLNTAG